jgi:hypothetical protein
MFSFLYHCQDFYRTWLYIWVTRRVSSKKQELLTLRVHPRVFGEVSVAPLFNSLCCPIMCLYILSSALWCPLRFTPKTMFDSSVKTTAYSSEAYEFRSVSLFVLVLFHHNCYMHCFVDHCLSCIFPSTYSFGFPPCYLQLFLNLKFLSLKK